jgi:hypothetical protein
MEALAQNKTLPDVSDLKDKKLSSTVISRNHYRKGWHRSMRRSCARRRGFISAKRGSGKTVAIPALPSKRPPIMVETRIEFVFKKGKVRDLQAER